MQKEITIQDGLSLLGILERLKSKALPIKTGYRLSRLVTVLQKEKETYIQTIKEIVEKYGEKDEEGNLKQNETGGIPIQEEHKEVCYKEIGEVDSTLITIDLPLIDIEQFGDIELSLEEILALDPIILKD